MFSIMNIWIHFLIIHYIIFKLFTYILHNHCMVDILNFLILVSHMIIILLILILFCFQNFYNLTIMGITLILYIVVV